MNYFINCSANFKIITSSYKHRQNESRTPFGAVIINWLIKLHANRLFFLTIHAIFFARNSQSGNRLQQKETYQGYDRNFRSALVGIEKSLLGQLLVWRNNHSKQLKLNSNSNSNRNSGRSKTKKEVEVLCLSRSWHFFDAVQKALNTDAKFLVRRIDISEYDDLLIAHNIYSKNKSLKITRMIR